MELDASFLQNGTYIWVINYPKIPPHLGLSIDGMYYSVTTETVQLHKSIDSLLRLFEAKKKPVFYVKLIQDNLSKERLEEAFKITLENGATCIEPINSLLFNDRFAHQTIGDLLNYLEQRNRIHSVHVPNYLTCDHVGVLSYGRNDVIDFIQTKKNERVFAV